MVELNYHLRKQNKPTKLERNPLLKHCIIDYLKQGWSPELISGYLKLQAGVPVISHETLYRFIYSSEGKVLKLHRYLMKKRRYRYPRVKRRHNMIVNARKKMISQRPVSINERRYFGHWEGDLILFQHTRTNVLTLRERKSRFILAIKNASRKAEHTTQALLHYRKNQSTLMETLTLDNGVEFSYHERISEKLKAVVYFCEPYKSYQKGAIENANRSLRQQLPRKLKIDKLDQQAIDNIANRWNNRPMKCLGFRTPTDVFTERSNT